MNKKIKIFVVFLFAILFVSGCSCKSSMCSKDDLANIRESLSEKYNSDEYKAKLRDQAISKDITDEAAIETYIKTSVEEAIEKAYNNHPKACLTTESMVDPDSGATISAKTWGDVFDKGLLDGLIVYPISWLLITFVSLFGSNGTAKILSIIVTTFIIKAVMLLFTFKQQIQMQKMQAIQPEVAAISDKLRNPNLSSSERYKLQEKLMNIYRRNDINPLAGIVPQLISIPIFLSVWSAVSQTLPIRTGEFLGIELGVAVSTQVFTFNIGAIILFLLMSGLQILSIKLPMIIRKKQIKNDYKLNKEQPENQANSVMTVMIVMILISGFFLPSALAVYWSVGAVFSIIQTLIFTNPKVKEKLNALGNRKKKAKVVQ